MCRVHIVEYFFFLYVNVMDVRTSSSFFVQVSARFSLSHRCERESSTPSSTYVLKCRAAGVAAEVFGVGSSQHWLILIFVQDLASTWLVSSATE